MVTKHKALPNFSNLSKSISVPEQNFIRLPLNDGVRFEGKSITQGNQEKNQIRYTRHMQLDTTGPTTTISETTVMNWKNYRMFITHVSITIARTDVLSSFLLVEGEGIAGGVAGCNMLPNEIDKIAEIDFNMPMEFSAPNTNIVFSYDGALSGLATAVLTGFLEER